MSTGEVLDTTGLRDAVTEAANQAAHGQRDELDRLFAVHHDELVHFARQLAMQARAGDSISPTGLLQEAQARLVDESRITARGSVFFRACFARVARRILVERARARGLHPHGRQRPSVDRQADARASIAFDLVQLHDAMDLLAALPGHGPRMAKVVELRVFVRLTILECAEALGVSTRTIDADWQLARRFLQSKLELP